MLCNQHRTHTQYPAKNRLLISSQEKLNTSPNSFAYENSLLVSPKAFVSCHSNCSVFVEAITVCCQQVHRHRVFPLLLDWMFTTWPCFFTQRDSRESELANMMGKQKPGATEQNPFHCSIINRQKSKQQKASYSLPEGHGAWICPLHQLLCPLHRCCNPSVPQLPLRLPAQALHLKRKLCRNS